jgi:glycosyltransferase involved in cell wall biosynthesis
MPVSDSVILGKDVRIFHEQLVNLYGCRVGDESKIGAFGVFASEAMSFGLPVCSFIQPNVREQIPDLPIVQCTIDTLKANLRELIRDREKRDKIGYEGWQFARRHFDQDRIYEALWKIYLDLIS